MITYNWTFPQFIIAPSFDGLTNVVTAMVWCCTGVDEMDGVSVLNTGRVDLPLPTPENFVPFDEITQELAMQWLGEIINLQGVEQIIADQIVRQRQPMQPTNPPFVAGSS